MGMQKLSQLSIHRGNLISKGIAYAPNRGELAFTVPGTAEFVKRQVMDRSINTGIAQQSIKTFGSNQRRMMPFTALPNGEKPRDLCIAKSK